MGTDGPYFARMTRGGNKCKEQYCHIRGEKREKKSKKNAASGNLTKALHMQCQTQPQQRKRATTKRKPAETAQQTKCRKKHNKIQTHISALKKIPTAQKSADKKRRTKHLHYIAQTQTGPNSKNRKHTKTTELSQQKTRQKTNNKKTTHSEPQRKTKTKGKTEQESRKQSKK